MPLTIEAVHGAARAGVAHTARGSYQTPCFIPVGTRGAVRYLSAADYERLGAEIVLANTYHLMLRPGAETVARFGGLGAFSGWPGVTLTDSGGFQVFSLAPDVDDDGVTFRSVYDGSTHRLTPESTVATQELLGADIQMVLDVCLPLPSPPAVVELAVARTAAWAQRARRAHLRDDQSLFGIVQGGVDLELRARSARATVELDFDGYAVGGLSVGERREEMLPALAAAVEHLPADRPRYLMGVGDPLSLVQAVALGVDQFDCVMQTRLGRHGTALTAQGKVHVKAARHATEDEPVDATCGCEVCARHSRGYLRHLFAVNEPSAARLLTLHNVAWTLALMRRMRAAIVDGTFPAVVADVAAAWAMTPVRTR
ncbi:MAG: tRNA guanosine(34) transglycosylase Tgt [Acidimicrobiia bacterium]|nr:tRNA guanosine(34) transglycosylase Tgt [Acidimicrobiia bacterium]